MFLKGFVELKKTEKTSTGARYFDDDGTEHVLTGNEIISRNIWGFQPSIFDHLKGSFGRFLEERGYKNNSELFIPTVVDELIQEDKAKVKVLHANDKCFGVTYRKDAVNAAKSICQLIEQGLYPENLWEKS
jgi:flavin-dependent dehydrogenase